AMLPEAVLTTERAKPGEATKLAVWGWYAKAPLMAGSSGAHACRVRYPAALYCARAAPRLGWFSSAMRTASSTVSASGGALSPRLATGQSSASARSDFPIVEAGMWAAMLMRKRLACDQRAASGLLQDANQK